MTTTLLLENQVAIVTGGTAGIGKAIALCFADQGATVFIFGTNTERGHSVVANAQGAHGSVRFLQVDVCHKEQIDAAFAQILAACGRIDILVNNAGIAKDTLLLRMKEEEWTKVIDVNLKSCFYTCQAVVKPFLKAKKGKIINVSSIVGLIGNAGQTNYAASKAGLIGFSKSLAKELASRNITVNCIAPGFIDTHMTQAMSEEKMSEAAKHIPLGRIGKPEEIAASVLFLASHMADYITGQVLVVDGGLSLGM